jgi:hypothetical protein
MTGPVLTRRVVLMASVAAAALMAGRLQPLCAAQARGRAERRLTADCLNLTVDWEHADASGADRGRIQRQ